MRSLLALSFLACVGAAQAFVIDLVSVGNFVPGVNYTANENVIYENAPGNLATLAVNGLVNNPGATQFLTGTAVWSGGPDSLTVAFASAPVQSGSGFTASYAGTWTYTSGTGQYAGLTGGGSWAVVFNSASNLYSNHSFSGELNAVPEPASMTLFAIAGGAAVLRRIRRRA